MPYSDPQRQREAMRAIRKRYKERHPDRHREQQRVNKSRQRQKARLNDKFIGVDGEGWTDDSGRHHYMVLVAGERVLYKGRPLSGIDCLRFIANLPIIAGTHYVSYFFDYDCTMILRDMVLDDDEKAKELVQPGQRDFGTFVTWRGFDIDYVPRKHIRVRRHGSGNHFTVIHDVRGFFQSSFVKALTDFDVGTPEERADIEAMKRKRSDFDTQHAKEIIEYCKHECRLLADLVSKLRDRFAHAGMSAHPYEGPGPVAGRELTKQIGRNKIKGTARRVPLQMLDYAVRAYYGGRFEVLGHGSVDRPVWAYDIKSAYPWACTKLPCLEHSRFVEGIESDLYVAHVSWNVDGAPWFGRACPLPFRTKQGRVLFPTAGQGWYWSTELPQGDNLEIHNAYSIVKECDCQPFEWVKDLYAQRQEMERNQKGSGIALKLTINSLYGKLAQRVGRAPHYSPIWAGLITAITRRKIYDVYLQHPGSVVMFATDAVFLTEPADELTIGDGLGEWELENGQPYNDFCTFLPGIYFDGGTARFKTRGIPKREFSDRADRFRESADSLRQSYDGRTTVTISRENHLGLRLALARGPNWYDRIGNWVREERTLDPSPITKRQPRLRVKNGVAWSQPYVTTTDDITEPYDRINAEEFHLEDLMWLEGYYDGDVD